MNRNIETRTELAAVPVGAVLVDSHGDEWEKIRPDGYEHMGHSEIAGDMLYGRYFEDELADYLPVTVLAYPAPVRYPIGMAG